MSAHSHATKTIWGRKIDAVLSSGRPLDELGIANWAFPASQALERIDGLEVLGVPVLGDDVLRIREGRASLSGEGWHCDQQAGEPWTAFVARSATVGRRYVSRFPPGRSPKTLFALVPG